MVVVGNDGLILVVVEEEKEISWANFFLICSKS